MRLRIETPLRENGRDRSENGRTPIPNMLLLPAALIHELPTDIGPQDFRTGDLLVGAGKQIGPEDREVG